ncbi:MAG TPA: DUF2079 domain-containing protein [Bacteroidia bacterium]|nr:DUF2079 domain-containing protein [Bacteroidia bacterium]
MKKAAVIIFVVFAIIYCSVSLVNHYFFRTHAHDLGINNNAIYDYAHLRWNDCMVMQPQFRNILSDHFTIYPILISPLYWIFGSYTMLIFQIAAILFGGWGILKLLRLKFGELSWIPLAGVIHFFSFYGIFSALAFDYHDNVVAAMFVPWLFYFYEKKNYRLFYLFLILILIGKENMALWSIFIALGLLALNTNDKIKIKHASLAASISFICFIAIISWIIPSLANENRAYLHFNYDALGGTAGEALTFMIKHPQKTFAYLIENHTQDGYGYLMKAETYYMLLLSGGFVAIIRPQYLLMILPVLGQKMLNNDIIKWGVGAHYSIEFAPVISVALFTWIYHLNLNEKKKTVVACCLTALCISAAVTVFDNRFAKWYDTTNAKFYDAKHWKSNFDVRELNQALKLIPDDANVSAQSEVLPHVAFRQVIYLFPRIADAEYVVLLNNENYYPTNREGYEKKIGELKTSPQWDLIYDMNMTMIFKRR